MKKNLNDGIAIGIIISIIVGFFFILFYPTPKLLVTPDFGRSDAWHFSISTKYIYWEELKNNRLPLWTPLLGGGFPLFAEGQIGALFLPNIIIFKLFDFPFAYNASLVITVMIFAFGIYLLIRTFTGSVAASFFGAVTGSLSGIIIPQLPHITLLQGLSLMPWVLLATYCLIKKQTGLRIAALAFIVAEQLYTGFPQAVFISLLLSTCFCIWNSRPLKKNSNILIFYACAIILGIGLSSIQLIPSFEFLTQSSVAKGFSAGEATYFSFPWSHIKTLFDPYLLGNPQFGSYPHFASFDGSIFWENTAYIGWLPLLFAVYAILNGLLSGVQNKTKKMVWFFVGILGIALLLMTGKHSPLYLVYSFWPFTLFRVPSRFIWVFVLCIITLSSFGVSYILSTIRQISHTYIRYFFAGVVITLFSLHTFQLWNTWKSYHLTEEASVWLTKPAILDSINQNGRLVSIGSEILHNTFFVSGGWSNAAPYRALRSALAPDSNAFWHIPSAQVYAGRNLRKKSLVDGILLAETTYGENTATISALGQKILSLQNVQTIISVYPLTAESLVLTDTRLDSLIPFYIYSNSNAAPRAYIAHHQIGASTVSEAANILRKDTFIPGSWVLVPKTLSLNTNPNGNTVITHQSDQRITIDVKNNTSDAILVLADTYYPGWYATVDGKQEIILPVNISQQGIRVPSGNHRVEFLYKPTSIFYGLLISTVSLLIALILTVYPVIVSLFHRVPTISGRGWDFSRNHVQAKLHKE